MAPTPLPPPLAAAVERALGRPFKDAEALEEALTHASAAGGPARRRSNERLEFLGDRVLGLIIAEALIARHPDAPEGRLAPRYNELVRRETCAEVGRRIALDEALRMTSSEEQTGGRDKMNLIANACEALIAALYLDGGVTAARAFVLDEWGAMLDGMERPPVDPKSKLQEWAQARGLAPPQYRVTARQGPDHAPRFTVEAEVAGEVSLGEGRSKRHAERAAAIAMLRDKGLHVHEVFMD